MRGLGFFILVFFYVLAAWGENSEEPKVTIVSPRDTEVLSSGAVTFEVSIEGIQVPQGQCAWPFTCTLVLPDS